jgi:hypothetical protein
VTQKLKRESADHKVAHQAQSRLNQRLLMRSISLKKSVESEDSELFASDSVVS